MRDGHPSIQGIKRYLAAYYVRSDRVTVKRSRANEYSIKGNTMGWPSIACLPCQNETTAKLTPR